MDAKAKRIADLEAEKQQHQAKVKELNQELARERASLRQKQKPQEKQSEPKFHPVIQQFLDHLDRLAEACELSRRYNEWWKSVPKDIKPIFELFDIKKKLEGHLTNGDKKEVKEAKRLLREVDRIVTSNFGRDGYKRLKAIFED